MFTANQHDVSECGPLTWVSKENRQRHLHNGRITVRTPPPLSAALPPSNPTDQQMFDGPEWGVDHGVATGFSPLAQGSPTVTEGFGALFDFDAASSGNPAFTWETSRPFASDAPMTSRRTPSTMRLDLQRWDHSLGYHRSQSWSPSIRESPAQFLADCTAFDFADNLHRSLTVNLPWFQVLGAIEGEPGMFAHFFAGRLRVSCLLTTCIYRPSRPVS